MATTLNVLVIEDSEEDTLLMVRELTEAEYSVKFEQVYSAATLAAALAKGGWDIIFSDFTLPGFSGTAALAQVRKHDSEVPFIFTSGTIGEDTAVAAMRTGADDYVMKTNLKRLVPAVELRNASSISPTMMLLRICLTAICFKTALSKPYSVPAGRANRSRCW